MAFLPPFCFYLCKKFAYVKIFVYICTRFGCIKRTGRNLRPVIDHNMAKKNEIVLYQPNDQLSLEVNVENDTVWLNRNQMAVLFDRDVKTIG